METTFLCYTNAAWPVLIPEMVAFESISEVPQIDFLRSRTPVHDPAGNCRLRYSTSFTSYIGTNIAGWWDKSINGESEV